MIIASAITRGRGTFCYSLLLRRDRRAGCHRSSVASASAVSLSITTGARMSFLTTRGEPDAGVPILRERTRRDCRYRTGAEDQQEAIRLATVAWHRREPRSR